MKQVHILAVIANLSAECYECLMKQKIITWWSYKNNNEKIWFAPYWYESVIESFSKNLAFQMYYKINGTANYILQSNKINYFWFKMKDIK